jgi:hypothetical protein
MNPNRVSAASPEIGTVKDRLWHGDGGRRHAYASSIRCRSSGNPANNAVIGSGCRRASTDRICAAAIRFGFSPTGRRRASNGAVHESAPVDKATSHE